MEKDKEYKAGTTVKKAALSAIPVASGQSIAMMIYVFLKYGLKKEIDPEPVLYVVAGIPVLFAALGRSIENIIKEVRRLKKIVKGE